MRSFQAGFFFGSPPFYFVSLHVFFPAKKEPAGDSFNFSSESLRVLFLVIRNDN